MSSQVQEQQTLHGSSSIRKSTYDNPPVIALPYTSTFLASVPIAKGKSTIPESAEMIEAMERRVSEIVREKASPQSGLDNLAIDLQRILGARARLRYPVKPT